MESHTIQYTIDSLIYHLGLLPPFVVHLVWRLSRKNLLHASLKVEISRIMSPGFIPSVDPVAKVDEEENRNADVRGEERRCAPILGPEDIETIYQGEEDEASHGELYQIGVSTTNDVWQYVEDYVPMSPSPNHKYTIVQQTQLMKPEVLVRLTNQVNTVEPLSATLRYARPV